MRLVARVPHARALSGMSLACALAFTLAACSAGDQEQPSATAPAETTATATAATSAAAPSSAAAQSTQAEATSSAAASTSPSTASRRAQNVEEARQRFGALAPDSLFDQFDSCDRAGIENSMACSGPNVGQFQFFESDSNAASSTQVLTELRSSRVMEDTGSRVVGWSILGNTALITVVENDLGLVMKQMVSIDESDPKEIIEELGLVGFNREAAQKSGGSEEPTSEAPGAS
ncbi:hypothetical protein NQ015_04265 [Corynebacterium sp. 153RC1]|uniref:hypothetical protein n=1 Tax=unclassified Corynebacterium TaxID=2624378 RepID=UPI00211B99F6|nr:hypothetical protein [Corynebacterium sp. 209RC1]MCQ9354088.1 hypothetical protein [Corynebacterium sp. 1222RC1]MCQ9356368.1 hypothetical protein [Corynebacterium sp. 122RC1]MCQ9358470.1 hypothetical protein [Corynebacterium sp. 142RC1]MCQ9360982.1 hypothetical protein [Corynebacterium sp. 153RC1]MCQ9363132.1 hypothetical protein [Corynebacterium sp. 732RC1]MCQ9364629.1 hypothetical protein [Corynebacterium sp. 70RC1]MCQ9371216.1 hypothetical protein [Corynebacterium sp. 35RC1]